MTALGISYEAVILKGFKIELTVFENLPSPLFFKEGEIPPGARPERSRRGEGRPGGIYQIMS
jgi:hypothetical protein